jgi:hypothetical protein
VFVCKVVRAAASRALLTNTSNCPQRLPEQPSWAWAVICSCAMLNISRARNEGGHNGAPHRQQGVQYGNTSCGPLRPGDVGILLQDYLVTDPEYQVGITSK